MGAINCVSAGDLVLLQNSLFLRHRYSSARSSLVAAGFSIGLLSYKQRAEPTVSGEGRTDLCLCRHFPTL